MLDNEALNKAVQCYMEYPPRAEIRKLVQAIIEKYLEHASKDSSCLSSQMVRAEAIRLHRDGIIDENGKFTKVGSTSQNSDDSTEIPDK